MNVEQALRRIDDANEDAIGREARQRYGDQRDSYEKTLRELRSAFEREAGVDEDEAVLVLTEWIVDEMRENGERPKSESVRGRAEEICLANDIEPAHDSWLRT